MGVLLTFITVAAEPAARHRNDRREDEWCATPAAWRGLPNRRLHGAHRLGLPGEVSSIAPASVVQ
jgi:hypothetical protein